MSRIRVATVGGGVLLLLMLGGVLGIRLLKSPPVVVRPRQTATLRVPAPDGWVDAPTTRASAVHLKARSGPGEEAAVDGKSSASLDDAIAAYVMAARFVRPGLTIVLQRDVHVAGADSARILVTRYSVSVDHADRQVDAIDVFAKGAQRRAAHLTLVVPAENDTTNLQDDVVSTFGLELVLPTRSP